MNDRFKFRFWSKTHNCYVDVLDLVGWTVSEKIPVWKNGNFLSMEEVQNVIPEQCTGLKDKTGKPIYEGDIVKHYALLEKNNKVLVCLFKNGCFRFNNTNDTPFNFAYSVNPVEIIGNIHENPELLENHNDDWTQSLRKVGNYE